MNDEEIFGQNQYENFINHNGNRVCFALSRRCRLYKYDKKIGVNLSLYTDYISNELFDDFYLSVSEPCECFFDTVYVIYADVNVYNFSTNSFEKLDDFIFEANPKQWFTNELKLSSCHISDNSQVKIKISYTFGKVQYATRGFIGKKQYKDFYKEYKHNDDIVLESTLSAEDNPGGRRKNSDWEGF